MIGPTMTKHPLPEKEARLAEMPEWKRQVLLTFGDDWQSPFGGRCSAHFVGADYLTRRWVLIRGRRRVQYRLTPLGLALRRQLQEEK